MKFENVFSLKDFFYYYFPGFTWILCFAVWIIPFDDVTTWKNYLDAWNPILNQISGAIWAVVLVIFPYLVGFMLNPLGDQYL